MDKISLNDYIKSKSDIVKFTKTYVDYAMSDTFTATEIRVLKALELGDHINVHDTIGLIRVYLISALHKFVYSNDREFLGAVLLTKLRKEDRVFINDVVSQLPDTLTIEVLESDDSITVIQFGKSLVIRGFDDTDVLNGSKLNDLTVVDYKGVFLQMEDFSILFEATSGKNLSRNVIVGLSDSAHINRLRSDSNGFDLVIKV